MDRQRSGVCRCDHDGALRCRRSYLSHGSVRVVFLTTNHRNKIRASYTRGILFFCGPRAQSLAWTQRPGSTQAAALRGQPLSSCSQGSCCASGHCVRIQGGRQGQRRGSSHQILPPAQGALPDVSPETSTYLAEARDCIARPPLAAREARNAIFQVGPATLHKTGPLHRVREQLAGPATPL